MKSEEVRQLPGELLSHPSRVRGLKYGAARSSIEVAEVAPFTGAWIEITHKNRPLVIQQVAPFTGAWIEIPTVPQRLRDLQVAPFTGAWIEIIDFERLSAQTSQSHPSRVRGLKSCYLLTVRRTLPVAPFTGAWIEITEFCETDSRTGSRTLHGCVD